MIFHGIGKYPHSKQIKIKKYVLLLQLHKKIQKIINNIYIGNNKINLESVFIYNLSVNFQPQLKWRCSNICILYLILVNSSFGQSCVTTKSVFFSAFVCNPLWIQKCASRLDIDFGDYQDLLMECNVFWKELKAL